MYNMQSNLLTKRTRKYPAIFQAVQIGLKNAWELVQLATLSKSFYRVFATLNSLQSNFRTLFASKQYVEGSYSFIRYIYAQLCKLVRLKPLYHAHQVYFYALLFLKIQKNFIILLSFKPTTLIFAVYTYKHPFNNVPKFAQHCIINTENI